MLKGSETRQAAWNGLEGRFPLDGESGDVGIDGIESSAAPAGWTLFMLRDGEGSLVDAHERRHMSKSEIVCAWNKQLLMFFAVLPKLWRWHA